MRKYHYLNALGVQMPPVDFESLRHAGINVNTMVWYEGLPTWMRAGDLPELHPIVGGVPPIPYCSLAAQAPLQQQPAPSVEKSQSNVWVGFFAIVLFCLVPVAIYFIGAYLG